MATMVERSGEHLADLWKVRLTPDEAPALQRWLPDGAVTVEDLLRSPDHREQPLDAVVLLLLRGDRSVLTPEAGTVLEPGDQLLLAGRPTSRRAMDMTLIVEPVCDYVVTGERQPIGAVWRALSARTPARASARR
jgi:hypothetical protein